MNTLNGPDNDLSRHLARKADQFARHGGSELELGQVLARAGEIRRGRRMRASIVMAAVVLAVAVPTALVAIDSDPTKELQPAPPVPTKVDRSPITLQGLEQGDAPRVGYAIGSEWRGPDGTVDLSGLRDEVVEVAPIDGGLLVATNDSAELTATFVTSDGEVVGEARSMDQGFAVSDNRRLVAFVQPDGTPVVIQSDGQRHELPQIPRGSGFSPVAVAGEDCAMGEEGNGCTVWVRSAGEKQQVWVSTSDRVDPTLPEFVSLADVHGWELFAGITEVKDDLTTCSAVTGGLDDPAPIWTVCGHHPTAFSPAGSLLLAEPDGDGLGPTGLAVYDARKGGDALLDLDTTHEAFVGGTAWEDETHVLATVYEKGEWAIVRIGLDGSRELAVAPVEGEDVEPELVLPIR